MTRNRVPAKEMTYQCQYMELPKDRDYHLIASEPYIDNANVMHHIVVWDVLRKLVRTFFILFYIF